MKIESFPQNTLAKIFYKHPTLSRGETVTFSYWDVNGTPIATDVSATAEIPNTGVYYLEITTPTEDTYWLFEGTDGEDVQAEVIKVGTPSLERVFYWNFNGPGETVPFEFYDISNNLLLSGNMTDLGNTFYSVVSQFVTAPWFVEIDGGVVINSTEVE